MSDTAVVDDGANAPLPLEEEHAGDVRARLPRNEMLVLLVAFLAPIAYHPGLASPFAALKSILILAVTGPGLVALGRLVLAGDRAARWAAGYLGAMLAATLLSGQIGSSFFGAFGWYNGFILSAGLVAFWAMGRHLSPTGRVAAQTVIIATAVLSSVFAWIGVVFSFGERYFVADNRAHSLMGNAVYFTTFLSAALVLVIDRAVEDRRYLIALFVVGGAIELAGGRIGLVAAIVTIVGAAVMYRRKVVLPVVAGLAGLITARFANPGVSALARVTADETDQRPDLWATALRTFGERPVLGWGPGRFDVVSGPYRRLGSGSCRNDIAIDDAHNFVLNHLVTAGVIGTVLFLGWLVAVTLQTRGPALVAAIAMFINLAVEPLWLPSIVPIALLVGAVATTRPSVEPSRAALSTKWRDLALVVSVLLALPLLVGEAAMKKADFDTSLRNSELAIRLLPNWTQLKEIHFRSVVLTDPQRSLAIAQDTDGWDIEDDKIHYYIGQMEVRYGSKEKARTSLERSNQLNPSSRRTLFGLLQLGEATGDTALADKYRKLLAEADALSCTPAQLEALSS